VKCLGERAATAALFGHIDEEAGVTVLGSLSRKRLERRLTRRYPRVSFTRLDIPVEAGQCHLAMKGLRLLGGAKSLSEDHGSMAVYWAEGVVVIRDGLKRGWKIYSLKFGEETSEHCHPEPKSKKEEKTTEIFHRIAGDPSIVLNEVEQRLQDRLVVPPSAWHKLVANSQTAVIMIEIEGPDPLGTSSHQYRE